MITKRHFNRGMHPNCRNGFKTGHLHPQETKDKISIANKGKHNSLKTEFFKGDPRVQDDSHPRWKGDEASYFAKHMWIRRKLGNPVVCQFCGFKSDNHKRIHWANVSGEYKRELSDWISLCVPCHKKRDLLIIKLNKKNDKNERV